MSTVEVQRVFVDSSALLDLTLVLPRHHDVSVGGLSVLLQQVSLSLEDVDRAATPQPRITRPRWGVQAVSMEARALNMRLTPQSIGRRDPRSIARAPLGFVAGVRSLEQEPAIPEYFSADTARRIARLGAGTVSGELESVRVATMNGRAREARIDPQVVQRAKQAAGPATMAYGSVRGLLTLLRHPRRGDRVVAEVVGPDRRAIRVHIAAPELRDIAKDLWGSEVEVEGILRRNAVGQALQLEADGMRPVPERGDIRAVDILGADPSITGGMTTSEYVDLLRRRAE